jgi:alpha/beta superfamily hydrolase
LLKRRLEEMEEKEIFIEAGGNRIEGLLAERSYDRAVIVTHPHPLYGGDMHNNVVQTIVRAYEKKGCTTLRFNFRGVGASSGTYSDGRGEQDDILAALNHLQSMGVSSIDLAGYSFGAWVICMGLQRFDSADRVILVSPPVDFMDFSFVLQNRKISLVISGAEDELAPPDMIEEMLPMWNPDAPFDIIDGADHFYFAAEAGLERALLDFLNDEEKV